MNLFAIKLINAYEKPGTSYPLYGNHWEFNEQFGRLGIQSMILSKRIQGLEALTQKYKYYAAADKLRILSGWISQQAFSIAGGGDEAAAQKVIELNYILVDPSRADLLIGEFYQRLGDLENAENYYLASLSRENDPHLFISLGQIYVEQAKQLPDEEYTKRVDYYNKARDSFEAAMRLDPSLKVESNYYLGNVYWQLNQRDEAVQAYLFVADNSKGHYAFLSNYYLGEIYSIWWNINLNYPQAETYFQQARTMAQNNQEKAMCLAELSRVYAAQGMMDLSKQYLSEAWNTDFNYMSTLQSPK